MSHIHLPDGVIPTFWWVLGYIVSLVLAFILLKRVNAQAVRNRIPEMAMMAAVMLITMSVPLGFIPFHMNFAALAGILLGPGPGFVVVFVANFILALLGHGGITAVGLNTLIIGLEALVGGTAFNLLKARLGSIPSSVVSTAMALLLSTALMILFLSLIGVVNIQSGEGILHGEHLHEGGAHEGGADQLELEESHQDDREYGFGKVTLAGWSAVLAVLLIGIVLECLVTALIVNFFMKVRPDIINPTSGEKR
ncbi:cobalt/nickel transport system permease protein [Caldicoprobacter guelmensis]|uniref:energy-coupling factor ABC transporter permease n=1 Tax=Caldicoprobacter guelmensis TaxID=1170224 RepID=UPI00195D00F8|nr:energy-coupling factor ABC transporter permease [Caldicoprobacter guelmensis]MBM7583105.1 cobalt/nickel transport system permease protein [Caldicoprobacter guelmensis]